MKSEKITHTRKNDFHKAIRKKKLCQAIWGDGDSYHGGILGKFDKGKIHDHEDFRKTKSGWYGKQNYKVSDKRRFESGSEQIDEFNSGI